MAVKKAAGRPPRYRTAKKMQSAVDEYFRQCRGEMATDEDGRPVLNKYGQVVMIGAEQPTLAGLAYELGFADKSSLYDYEKKPEFEWVIRRARLRIEAATSARLFDRDGQAGARFSLQNNFEGYRERAEVTVNAGDGGDVMGEVWRRMESAEAGADGT